MVVTSKVYAWSVIGLCERVRQTCAQAMAEARFVTIDDELLDEMAPVYARLVADLPDPRLAGPRSVDELREDQVIEVLALDAINFGSGYHDVIRKDAGSSGARSMAARLTNYAAMSGPLTAARLRNISPVDASAIFGQELDGGALEELMTRFSIALVDLGDWLADAHGGSAVRAVAAADRSAESLATSLLDMPFYRDVETVDLLDGPAEVAFYKRAQITPADIERTCGPGLFDDLDTLTAFADNLVPHVLRLDGVLRVDDTVVAAIDAGQRLEPGCRSEVELRAAGVVAVDALAERTGARAMDLDQVLWERGGRPAYKARKRHRSRSVFY